MNAVEGEFKNRTLRLPDLRLGHPPTATALCPELRLTRVEREHVWETIHVVARKNLGVTGFSISR